MAEDDKGREKGKGGGDRGGNAPDTPFEVALSMLLERLGRVFGSRVMEILPDSIRNEAKRLARGRNLATAIRTIGRVAEIFGDDEEIRGAIRGFTDGISGGFVTIEGDGKEVPKKMQEALDANPDLKRLEALKAAGRFDGPRPMPFSEALTYISRDYDPERHQALMGIIPLLGDGGLFLDAKLSARDLQGLADLIIGMGGPSPEVAAIVKRRLNPASTVKKAVTVFEEGRAVVKKQLDLLNEGGNGVPFVPRVRAETNRQGTGYANYEAAMERVRANRSTGGAVRAFFRRQWDKLKRWYQSRNQPPVPAPGPAAGGPPPSP